MASPVPSILGLGIVARHKSRSNRNHNSGSSSTFNYNTYTEPSKYPKEYIDECMNNKEEKLPLLINVARYGNRNELKNLLSYEDVPLEVINEIGERKDPWALELIVRDERCPLDILLKVIKLNNDYSRIAAHNPNLPIEMLLDLVKNSKEHLFDTTLVHVTKMDRTTTQTLRKIVEFLKHNKKHMERYIETYEAITENNNCTVELLNELLFENDSYARHYAINALLQRATDEKTSDEDLRKISNIRNIQLQIAVANNRSCPEDLVMNLKNKPLYLFFSKSTRKRVKEVEERVSTRKFTKLNETDNIEFNKMKPIVKNEEDLNEMHSEDVVEEKNNQFKM